MKGFARVGDAAGGSNESDVATRGAHQAYVMLHWTFVVLPTIVGIDKFFHRIADWNGYLAPTLAHLSPFSVGTTMKCLGVLEMIAGLVVALRPRVGGYLVALWLLGIVVNLLIARDFYDIALRDLALSVSALALARLARAYETRGVMVPRRAA